MNYWNGPMDWPLNKDWVCETCNKRAGLSWGMPHAICRCNACHTQYRMRDENDSVVDVPISRLKDEFKGPAKQGYEKYQRPISEFSDAEWNSLLGGET